MTAAAPGLGGVLGPVVTTFGPDGELARAPFEANARAHLAAGLHGLVVAGSTGEAPLLEEGERRRIVEWARGVVPGDRLLVVGIGAESTRLTSRRAREAAEAGADAVLVVAPHYYTGAIGRAALDGHFRRVADESPVPVLLYNIPKYAHFALDPALVAGLARHGNVRGMKDSAGDLALLDRYLDAQSEEFSVLTGSATTFADALARGARGGILAASLFAPTLCLEILRQGGRGDAARAAQRRLLPLGAEVVGAMGVAGVKAALDLVGLHGGPTRAPLLDLDRADRERLAALLRAAEPPAAT